MQNVKVARGTTIGFGPQQNRGLGWRDPTSETVTVAPARGPEPLFLAVFCRSVIPNRQRRNYVHH